MSVWIDIKEKQPSFCENVLAINNNNIQRVVTYGTEEWEELNTGNGFGGSCITHWMPLPKLPDRVVSDYDRGYQQGRADAIEEVLERVSKYKFGLGVFPDYSSFTQRLHNEIVHVVKVITRDIEKMKE